MYVVLDTNIIYSDFHLKGAEIISLCQSIELIDGEVCIPEVVMREVINKYKEKLTSISLETDKALKSYSRLTGKIIKDNPISKKEVENEAKTFESYFRERVEELGIKVLPISTVPHDDVIARDLARRKPFTIEGKGYRDTLIWESILEILDHAKDLFEAPTVIFVNKNYKDFCEDKTNNLHSDLVIDLVAKGLKDDCIRIVSDISTVTKDYIKPTQKVLQKVINKFNEHKFYKEINLDKEVIQRATHYLEDRTFDLEDSPLRSEFENPTITDVDDIKYRVTDVRVLSEDSVQIDLTVNCACSFDFYIYKADAIILDEDEMPTIIDSDWNDHYMAACETQTLTLSMSLIVDRGFTEVSSESISIN